MKNNYIAITLGIFLSASSVFTACGTAAESSAAASAQTTAVSQTNDDETAGNTESDHNTSTVAAADEQTEESSSETAASDGDAENSETPPEMPDGEGGPGNGQAPPGKPDGQGGPGNGQAPPDKPDGEGGPGNGQAPPDKPDGEGGPGGQGGPGGAPGGQSSGVDSYDAVNTITSDTTVSDQTVVSTGTDENAILVQEGAAAALSGLTVSRTSSDSTGGDNASFYGVGAAVLTTEGTAYLSGSTITTDAKGGAGVFSYGSGSTVYVSDTEITTAQDTSGGIHAAGGGTLYAWDLDVITNGGSSAAIRSDRGGGTMVVNGGSYTSNGSGSPAIYSTADVAVNNAQLTATGSEAICIEGLNSIHLFDSDLSGDMPDQEQNDCTWNVILYQSMSGDSEVGNSTFEMSGGTLTAKNGGMFYTTNTESTFILSNVDITYADENDFFLKCTGNSNARGWGSTGSNGADCSFTAISQEMEGDVIWDSVSTLDFYMTEGSTLKGAVVDDESAAGNGGSGTCSLYIDSSSVWTVTADSDLTSLSNAGTIVDESGKTVSIVGTDGIVYVKGDSALTVTVENYSDSADLSGASALTSWSDYAVEKPAELE